jgi:ferredoxin-NADP reductase
VKPLRTSNSSDTREVTMAVLKPGRITKWTRLSSKLAIFRLVSEDGAPFPDFEAGQYIALRRDDCLLTRKITDETGTHYVPDLDAAGLQKHGPVTHSYSIASAPFEAARDKCLEFYIVLEIDREGTPGRFTESVFRVDSGGSDQLSFMDRIVGDFTLRQRSADDEHVLMVGTGTGLAPFVSMIKQLHHESQTGSAPRGSYTLLHTNRTYEELAYHHELITIEASGSFDFLYIPTVSRPTDRDRADSQLGTGRANNVLRHIFGLPPREADAVAPGLPRDRPLELLEKRVNPSRTVVLTCGNPDGMADIEWIASHTGMRFEKEEW